MSTIDTIRERAPRAGLRRLGAFVLYLVGRYDLAVERFRSRRALEDLDERLLRDIGVSFEEASQEYQRPFWD